MGKSKIEWTQKVWNPVTGCTKVSEGCRNCYAERMSKRLAGRVGYPKDGFKVTLHPEKLNEPLRWKKPSRIFVCSMGDLFHVNVPFAFVDKVIRNIRLAPQHTFLILTKRSHYMKEYFSQIGEVENLWLGVSVEDQKTADERIPLLLQTPAAKRFVSYEPALGPVDFSQYFGCTCGDEEKCHGCPPYISHGAKRLDWIIMGGESGPGARPMHPDWARSARDQCKVAGVPFFFKQWGEWAVVYDRDKDDPDCRRCPKAKDNSERYVNLVGGHGFHGERVVFMRRIGKARAGCLLDGKEHMEAP